MPETTGLTAAPPAAKYPGTLMAIDGNTAVVLVESAASEAAGSYPISPSSQMGEGFATAAARGELNAFGRPLIFIEPEGEHAAAGVTAGMAMAGLRAANFSSGQGIAYMHESLYAAAGKRLPYVLSIGCRAMTKQSLNVHAGHDDYHCIEDTGFIQVMAKNVQQVADLNLIARRTAELALTPAAVGMDGWLTSHVLESMRLPERELIREYLGSPDDVIECPTPSQRMLFGKTRRRVPKLWDVDNPAQVGVVQNQDSYAQGVAAQRPYFYDHVDELGAKAMEEYAELTGRRYDTVLEYRTEDAEYLIVAMGSCAENAEAAADWLRATRGVKVGVVQVVWFRPFPGARLARVLKGRKGVVVLERTDHPLAGDLPLIREIRGAVAKALENGRSALGPERRALHAGYPAMRAEELPILTSGCYGLGSRDLKPRQLVGAVENLLQGAHAKPFFYLGVEFPEHKDYPKLRELAVEGSEDPNLLPEGAIAVRIHSIGGWGAVTMGKNLSGTLFDLLGLHLKCNPKYGGEKKGTPTTYYGAFAPERIRVNCELSHVDVVLSPDPNVFAHTNALAGLKPGGAFVIQTASGAEPASVWRQFPERIRKLVAEKDVKVWYVDAFGISKQEASTADLQMRMQGTVFQGAFFRATALMGRYGLDEAKLFGSIEGVLNAKFGGKGRRVVEDNMRVVRRGYDEVKLLDWRALQDVAPAEAKAGAKGCLPRAAEQAAPDTQTPVTRADLFYDQVGKLYGEGKGDSVLADPFAALSLTPAVTGTFRDMTQIRFEYPRYIAEKCTGCAKCWTQCPDTAIPGLAVKPEALVRSAARALGAAGDPLSTHAAAVAARLREKTDAAGKGATVQDLAKDAVLDVAKSLGAAGAALAATADRVRGVLSDFRVARTQPFWDVPSKKAAGPAFLAITVNPESCKGCMECVEVCGDGALVPEKQDPAAVESLRRGWDVWKSLPDSDPAYVAIKDLDVAQGVLSSLLLTKRNYLSTVGGDGACMGCGEKTPIHLFCAVAEALMLPRVAKHVERLRALLERVDEKLKGLPANAAARRARLEAAKKAVSELVWRYTEGPTGRGRTAMGMVNSTGCTTVWGSTYPYNPYPFPWANHLFQDAPSVAMGVFEGHCRDMAIGFRAVRIAELEVQDAYEPAKHDRFFELFDWRHFSDEEFLLTPPVTCLGGDGAMLDIGFQNLSRMLISGRPIKVLVVDTQVYSNTGGQACTSAFIGQVSEMADFGERHQGKLEPRKEIGLIGMAHRGVFTAQTSAAHTNHMLKAFILGFNSRRPALFSTYSTCQPEHGVGDDMAAAQAKLALEGRAFPFFVYNPDGGPKMKDRLSLMGNPAATEDWPTYTLELEENGQKAKRTLPMTFADFAATEGRFSKHFKPLKDGEIPEGQLVPFAEFLDLPKDAREGKVPYLWVQGSDKKARKCSATLAMVESALERRDFWRLLQDLAGIK
ncbi:MAG: 2-oxoacid:acceptor oxidoreductase family protein [Elusimicrobia bacterium]|nr:2-oxoacid:acceptor oxidoreductase family protein [Elusimicrobiota bacterium]